MMIDLPMMSQITTQILLSGRSFKPLTHGEVCIQTWTSAERWKRSLKASGLCFGFALISILIPGLHFILVPGFLIACPLVGFYMYQQEQMIISGQGPCPECGAVLMVAKRRPRFPIHDLCTSCQLEVKLTLQN
jgi:hypothetical protein